MNSPSEKQDFVDLRSQSMALVQRICKGDAAAFDALYRLRAGKVLGLVMYLMGPGVRKKYDPEDIAQEVWIEVQKSLAVAPPTTSFGAWVGRIASRKIGRLKKNGDRSPSPFAALSGGGAQGEFGQEPAGDSRGPSRATYRKEAVEQLVEALESLTRLERDAWTLHWLEERPYAEIAPLLDRTPEALAQIVKRVTKKLRQRLTGTDTSSPKLWNE